MTSSKWRYVAALLVMLPAVSALAQDGPGRKIAVLPFGVFPGGENPVLDRILFEAVVADGRFTPLPIYSPAAAPDLPPQKSQAAGLKYAITAQVYPGEDAGGAHARVWIWDTETGGLVITDEMVYYDPDEAQDVMNALAAFLLSKIPEEAEAPPPEAVPPRPVPAPVLVRQEDGETPAEETPSPPPLSGPGVFFSAAWAPFLPVYGQKGAELDRSFNPAGGIFKAGVVPLHSRAGSFGLELGVTYNFLGENPKWALQAGSLLNAGLSFIYLVRIKNSLFAKVTLGGGAAVLFDEFTPYSGGPWSPANQTFVPNAAAGLSFIMRFGYHFFIDLGGAFTIYFPKGFPERSLGLISPRVGFGWQVN
ncbi:MAG: hypothetical protein LBF78_12485 [Treponema sp.]|jgi:hypothetical protein|nr:hypothetical protein [Treponema sp.]